MRHRAAALLGALLAVVVLAGCASVPGDSPVQVLRRVTDGDGPELPAGPVDGSDPLTLVRGFVNASGSTLDRHGAARAFLTPATASTWNDGASLTVLGDQFDTVYPPTTATDPNVATVRIRGGRVGSLDANGAFDPAESPVEIDVTVVRREGHWRIDALPEGVLVRQSDFAVNFRGVSAYFVDPVRGLTVSDLRYLPAVPSKALPSRAVSTLLTGPSAALDGAARSAIPVNARLRSNVTESPDGALIVDLTQLGDLGDAARRLVAAQVVLTLAEINVTRVRLLVDGTPLLDGRPDLTPDMMAGLSGSRQPSAELPGMVVAGGTLRVLPGDEPAPGQAGNGAFDVATAATTADGRRVALAVREGARQRLLVGPVEGPLQHTGLATSTLTRPTWTPSGSEVWSVLGGSVVARVTVDEAGGLRTDQVNAADLAALGPIADLRLSRDGLRVAAAVGGGLVTGAVVREASGDVAIRNVRRLRPSDLRQVVGVDWRGDESLIVVTQRQDHPVSVVSADGLTLQAVPGSNLTGPLRAVAAASSRPFLVADQGGIWSFDGGDLDSWRQVLGGAPDAIPLYPG